MSLVYYLPSPSCYFSVNIGLTEYPSCLKAQEENPWYCKVCLTPVLTLNLWRFMYTGREWGAQEILPNSNKIYSCIDTNYILKLQQCYSYFFALTSFVRLQKGKKKTQTYLSIMSSLNINKFQKAHRSKQLLQGMQGYQPIFLVPCFLLLPLSFIFSYFFLPSFCPVFISLFIKLTKFEIPQTDIHWKLHIQEIKFFITHFTFHRKSFYKMVRCTIIVNH